MARRFCGRIIGDWSSNTVNRLVITASAMLMALGAAPLAAASINSEQANQRRLIDAGVRSGKLTPHEARNLRAEQDSIEHEKARLKARGGYSDADRRIIHSRQATAGRHIDAAKANGYRAKPKKIV